MPNSESLRAVRRDLRRAGISSRVSTKDSTVLLLPGLGGEEVATLRLLYPALQAFRIRTSINPTPPNTTMKMKISTVLVGFFDVKGFGPDSVEVPVTGNGPHDYSACMAAIRAKHPGVHQNEITRTGSNIEQRTGTTQNYLGDVPGQTVRQLFDGALALDKPLPAVLLGRCFFSGAPYDITLLFSRSSGQAGVVLRPRTPSSGIVSFQNKINPMILVTELPQLIREILGGDARDIRLNTRPPAPPPPLPPLAKAALISKTPENVAEISKSNPIIPPAPRPQRPLTNGPIRVPAPRVKKT